MRAPRPDRTAVLAAVLRRSEGFFHSRARYLLAIVPAWILLPPVAPHSGLEGVSPFLLLIPSVLLAGALGGGGPGLLATLIGLGCGLSAHPPGSSTVWQAATFTGIGASVAVFGEMLRASRREIAMTMAAIEAREQRLQSILDTVPDAMVLINGRGEIQAFSKTAERLFGYSADEVQGRNVQMLMPGPYRDNHDAYLRRYERTGEKRIIGIGRIVVAQRRDGSTFPIELAVGEVKGGETQSGDGGMFTGFIRDLSERQSTEVRLQELQAELVHMSRLTALGEMSSALAHELNQPLSAIANYLKGVRRLLEPLAQEPGQGRVQDALDRATEQALRAGEIIRRLRDFVRRGETEQRVESLAKIVEEAGALALVGAKEHGVHVTFHLDPECDTVLTDRVQVQQVLLNLIRNAIEAMAGQPRRELLVSSGPVDAAAGGEPMIEVSVQDTGAGLAEPVAAQLFQPFVTTKANGLGVGLSICRTIIEAHGGRIWATPNPQGGTVFHFTLRGVTDAEAASDVAGQPGEAGGHA
jgi:two-component system sensor kinase FixL